MNVNNVIFMLYSIYMFLLGELFPFEMSMMSAHLNKKCMLDEQRRYSSSEMAEEINK